MRGAHEDEIRVLHEALAAYKCMLRRLAVAFFVQTCIVVAWAVWHLSGGTP
jgi:hypothetical protein